MGIHFTALNTIAFTRLSRRTSRIGRPPIWRFKFVCHGITFSLYVEMDEICNLVRHASPFHCQFDPVQTIKTGFIGSINMQRSTISVFASG